MRQTKYIQFQKEWESYKFKIGNQYLRCSMNLNKVHDISPSFEWDHQEYCHPGQTNVVKGYGSMEGICWSCCAFGVILNIFIFKKVSFEFSDLIPVYTTFFISSFFNSKLTLNSRVLVVRQIITFMHSIIVITCANVCWKDFTISFLHFSCNSNITTSN